MEHSITSTSPPIFRPISPIICSETKNVSEFHKLFSNYLKNRSDNGYYDNYTMTEKKAIFLHELIQSGNVGQIYEFCTLFDSYTLKLILNATPYVMYFGNVLHAVLYYNTGNIAKELYVYFRNLGATPCMDYYKEYPWQQSGIYWVCIPGLKYNRDQNEFKETYKWITEYENSIKPFVKTTDWKPFSCHCDYHLEKFEDEIETDFVTEDSE